MHKHRIRHGVRGADSDLDLERLLLDTARTVSTNPRLAVRPFELRPDAVRPPQWVMRHNPHFRERAHLEGDLRASIIATLRWDPDAGTSAVEIQHRCGCRSYPPVLHAIHQLERAGTIERVRVGTSKRIRLTGSAA